VSSSAPWWAVPSFTLAGVLLTLGWNTLAERLRRRAERTARWDPDKLRTYREQLRAGQEILQVPVWPDEPSATPVRTRPLLERLFQANEELADLAPREVTLAANAVAAGAEELADVIDDIRTTTRRGHGGAVATDATDRLDAARRTLAEAVDGFATAYRQDLGITAPYAPSRRRT
jgi:hypothetical protein